MSDKCLIIAEAGVNHNGNLETALKLCDAVKKSGADVIKFQTWKTENIITRNVDQAEYQKDNTGKEESQFDMLKRLELPYDDFRRIKEYCDKIGLVFSSTADDEESLDFLLELGIPFIKVGSGDIGNVSYLRYIGSKHLPVILSTGMSTLDEVEISLNALKEGGAKEITLLHCTTSYPCPMEDVNLRAMLTLKDRYGLPVGYSDHTLGDEVAVAALSLGAKVIEKHFTLDRNMEGPDHLASTEPDEFAQMVKRIRNIESALGTGEKKPTDKEKDISKVVTKRMVAKRKISKGEALTAENVTIKRNDIGRLASEWDEVIGKKADKDYAEDEGIVIKA